MGYVLDGETYLSHIMALVGLRCLRLAKQRNVIVSHVRSWAVQRAQPQLTRVSGKLYGLIVDFLKTDAAPYFPSILEAGTRFAARISAREQTRYRPLRTAPRRSDQGTRGQPFPQQLLGLPGGASFSRIPPGVDGADLKPSSTRPSPPIHTVIYIALTVSA